MKRLVVDNASIPTEQYVQWLIQIIESYEKEVDREDEKQKEAVDNVIMVLNNSAGRLISLTKRYRFLLTGFILTNLGWFSIYMGWA